MHKTKHDKMYETPSRFQKLNSYLNYQLRMFQWKIFDYLETHKTNSNPSFKIDKDYIKNWNENGFLHLPNFFKSDFIEEINESVIKSRQKLEKSRKSKNLKSGRISNLHSTNRDIFKLLNDPILKEIQKNLLSSNNPVLWGSIYFKQGTQQKAHSDAPFFYVEPYGSMIGMWIALEDIHRDSGPLFYIPHSHLKPISIKEILNKNIKVKNEVEKFRKLNTSASLRKYWDLSSSVNLECNKQWTSHKGEQITNIKKGDVFFWHQWLIHGGSPVKNNALTRKSIVSHWVSKESTAYDMHNYFLNFDRLDEKYSQKLPIKKNKNSYFLRQYRTSVQSWD